MKILAIRFSAMGDVVLTMPILKSVLKSNPELQMDVLTRKSFQVFFKHIERLNIREENIDLEFKSLTGLVHLFNQLRKEKYDLVIDLHGSLRSKILCYLFYLSGVAFATIDKGRAEKKKLLGNIRSNTKPLKHTLERYADVFRKCNIVVETEPLPQFGFKSSQIEKNKIEKSIKENIWESHIKIGIAPFSQHQLKSWPIERIHKLIELLVQEYKHRIQIFLFGGGHHEMKILSTLQEMNSECIHIAGDVFNLAEQIEFMNHLDMMITMDSANLHLANLTQCKNVISLWGPTHTYLGFGPLIPDKNVIIEILTSELSCRPCSVYGNIPCSRGDHACMEWISVDKVVEQVKSVLSISIEK